MSIVTDAQCYIQHRAEKAALGHDHTGNMPDMQPMPCLGESNSHCGLKAPSGAHALKDAPLPSTCMLGIWEEHYWPPFEALTICRQ